MTPEMRTGTHGGDTGNEDAFSFSCHAKLCRSPESHGLPLPKKITAKEEEPKAIHYILDMQIMCFTF